MIGYYHQLFRITQNSPIKNLSSNQKKGLVTALAVLSLMAGFYFTYRCYSLIKEHFFSYEQSIEFSHTDSPVLFRSLNKQEKNIDHALEINSFSTWKPITPSFPSIEEAKILLAKHSSKDPLLDTFSAFDRQIRMKRRGPVSSDDFLIFYLQQIKTLPQSLQITIQQYLDSINASLEELRIQLPQTIHFIRSTGNEEIQGTAAYCRYQTIVFNSISKKLVAHELFHIYSRCNPDMRKKLYALVGYHVISPLSLPDALKEKRIINPDLPLLDAYINVKYQGKIVQAIPLDLFDLNYEGRGKSPYFEGMYHKFAMLEKTGNGDLQFKIDDAGNPSLFDFDEAEDLIDQIGKNTSYVDSAEEILADNFAMMVLGDKGESPELIEKMKQCFLEENKRLAFEAS